MAALTNSNNKLPISKLSEDHWSVICGFLDDRSISKLSYVSKGVHVTIQVAAPISKSLQIKALAETIISKTGSSVDKNFLERFRRVEYTKKTEFPTLFSSFAAYKIDRSLILMRLLGMDKERLAKIDDELQKGNHPPFLKHIAELAICMKKRTEAETDLQQNTFFLMSDYLSQSYTKLAETFIKCGELANALKRTNKASLMDRTRLVYMIYDKAFQLELFQTAEKTIEDGLSYQQMEIDFAYQDLCKRFIKLGKYDEAMRLKEKIQTPLVKSSVDDLLLS